MRDRLAELQQDAGAPIISETTIDIEVTDGAAEMAQLSGFFTEIDEIRGKLSDVRKRIQEVEQQHNRSLTAIGADSKGKSNKLDDIMDMINADIQFVRRRLKEIETENRKVGADSGKTNLTAEQRIRLSQHGNVSKKFLEIVAEYQEIQTKYKVKFRDRIERQIKIVKPDATAEEIDRLIESGETELFAQQILSSPQQAEARKALSDIQDRHEDIIKIEKSILELHQLFLDMAVLVDAQGDMINQIENYVQSAADHTGKGLDEMKKAVKAQKKSRKRACCLLILILIVVIAITVVATTLGRR